MTKVVVSSEACRYSSLTLFPLYGHPAVQSLIICSLVTQSRKLADSCAALNLGRGVSFNHQRPNVQAIGAVEELGWIFRFRSTALEENIERTPVIALTFFFRGENNRVREAALTEGVSSRNPAFVLLYRLQGTQHSPQRGSIHFNRAERVAHVFWKDMKGKGESDANLMNQ